MDWRAAVEEQRAALQRIVALLFALADLCDLASARALPVRAFVLWLLRPAEVLARDYILGEAEPASFGSAGNTPDDAARLAERFRALAYALECQAAVAFFKETRQHGPAVSAKTFARQLAATLTCHTRPVVRAPDTS